jgi:hypothetical protein
MKIIMQILCIEENNLKNLFLYAKFLNLKNIQTYQGLMKESGRNISNIVFFEFK